MLGTYVYYSDSLFAVVFVKETTCGIVALQSRGWAVDSLIVVVDQRCVSIVTDRTHGLLTALYGHPGEFMVGIINY